MFGNMDISDMGKLFEQVTRTDAERVSRTK